jgi:hypothetical protein
MTPEQYEAIRVAQGHRCAICSRHEDELPVPRTGRPRKDGSPSTPSVKLVVDHCYVTDRYRGLLCNNCNVGLGAFGDDPERLLRAVEYLGSTMRVDVRNPSARESSGTAGTLANSSP